MLTWLFTLGRLQKLHIIKGTFISSAVPAIIVCSVNGIKGPALWLTMTHCVCVCAITIITLLRNFSLYMSFIICSAKYIHSLEVHQQTLMINKQRNSDPLRRGKNIFINTTNILHMIADDINGMKMHYITEP